MYYILGLQNQGKEHIQTPHNIGGEILDLIKDNLDSKIIFSKTFMNNSGDNLNQDVRNNPEKLIVIQDDIDMNFGKIKIVFGKNDGGHNGIKDIVNKLKTNKFVRIKIGVCPQNFLGQYKKPKRENLNRYLVNKKLPNKYLKQYPQIADKIQKIIQTIEIDGYKKAMNLFN